MEIIKIEANPVRAGYVETPEGWRWSSARARMTRTGLVPDDYYVPVLMKSLCMKDCLTN